MKPIKPFPSFPVWARRKFYEMYLPSILEKTILTNISNFTENRQDPFLKQLNLWHEEGLLELSTTPVQNSNMINVTAIITNRGKVFVEAYIDFGKL